MDPMDTGLRHRIKRAARQMATQHREIRSLGTLVRDAIKREAAPDSATAFARLQVAIEAHFKLEDDVFFPALHGLHPGSARDLEGLSREHARLVADLERLRGRAGTTRLDALGCEFEAFAGSLADHEQREERLVSALTGGAP